MKILSACAIAALFMLAGCGGKFSSPESTVKTMLEAIRAKDEAGAKACLVAAERKEDRKVIGEESTEVSEGNYSVGSATVSGDTGKVPVKFTGKDGKDTTLNVVCRKEEGEWKISMKETFARMFSDAFKDAKKKSGTD